jgi:phosphatidylinositol glycan class B
MRALLSNRLYAGYALLAVLIAAVTSYSNFGHLCGDEYSQIFEFAAWKLGQVAHADLRLWEFDSQMRPTFQIWMVVGIQRLFGIFSPEVNPFAVNYLVYFLSGLLSIVSILVFTGSLISRVKAEHRDSFVILSLFTWLVLYTNTHFNSENICGHLLLLAVGLLYAKIDRPGWGCLVAVGLLLGISFSCRFQIGFSILGLMVWLFVTMRARGMTGRWLLLLVSLLVSILIFNTVADSLFYGRLVFSPYNYYYQNIATGTMNRASGVSPWYAYLFLVFIYLPFGPAYIIATLHQFVRYPRDIITSIIAPFVLFHLLIGHKEVRFLLPLLGFMPLLIMVTLEDLTKRYQVLEKNMPSVIKVVWIVNLLACVSLLIPSATEIGGWRYLHAHYKQPTILYFQPSVHQKLLYYKRPNLRVVNWQSGQPTPCPPGYNVVIALSGKSKDPKPPFPQVYTFFPFSLNAILPPAIVHSIGYFDLYEVQNVEDGKAAGELTATPSR